MTRACIYMFEFYRLYIKIIIIEVTCIIMFNIKIKKIFRPRFLNY
jgi:hypothetical protein